MPYDSFSVSAVLPQQLLANGSQADAWLQYPIMHALKALADVFAASVSKLA